MSEKMQRIRTSKPKRRANKWLYIGIIVVILLVASVLLFLHSADKPVRAAKQEAVDRIKGHVTIKNVSKSYIYNGPNEDYTVLLGKNSAAKKIAVWVPKKKTGKVYVKYAADGISELQAKAIVSKAKHPDKILHVKLGMEKEQALWEVTYLSSNGNLNYINLAFEDGRLLKAIENL